jgi:hypothetical protein
MDMKLEVYPNDELGEYRNEKDGCKCSMGPCRKLSSLVRMPEDVSSECQDESGGLNLCIKLGL